MVRTSPECEPDHFKLFAGSSPKFNQVAKPEPQSGPRFEKLGPKTGWNWTTAPLGLIEWSGNIETLTWVHIIEIIYSKEVLLQYKSIKVLEGTHVEARQGCFSDWRCFIDMSITVWFPAVNVAPDPVQTAVKWKYIYKKQNHWYCQTKLHAILQLPLTTQLLSNACIFCCERTGHNFWHFNQIWTYMSKYHIWKAYNSRVDIGRIQLNRSIVLL